jgi:TonB family protein
MLRDIIISITGHILVFAGLIFAPMIGRHASPPIKTMTVNVVTPQSISQLLAKNAIAEEPRPKVPQVVIEKEKLIPNPEKQTRKVQTVKRSAETNPGPDSQGGKGTSKSKGPNLPEGVKTDQTVDNAYLAAIQGIIYSNWKFPNLNDTSIKSVVFFEIGRDGRIIRLRVEKRSGHLGFDKSTYDAIMASNPFPPLPDSFSGIKLGIHLTFTY